MEEQELSAKKACDIIQQGLQQTYLAKKHLMVPMVDKAHTFPITECFIHLALVKQSEQENLSGEGNVEASLAIEEQFHANKKPLPLPQLFAPIDDGEEIPKRILITGRAGIGKSTLCHYIAYQWANPQMQLFKQFKYVFWLSLKTVTILSNNAKLTDWIYKECFKRNVSFSELENILYDKKEECLLLLDGFDEIATLYAEHNELLHEIIGFPNVIITSRPYHISLTNFDRQLENVGFTDASVDNYLKKFFSHAAKPDPEAEKTLRQFIRRQPLLKSVAHIPLNLLLLCELWQTQGGKELANQNPLTLVQLYQEFYKEFLRRTTERENKQAKNEKSDTKKIVETEKLYSEALTSLEQTAFHHLCQLDGNLIIPKNKIKLYGKCEIRELLDTGFLRRIADRHEYYFVHLTFQEYFAARYLLHALNPAYKDRKEFKDAIQFIRQNKYHPRYAIVMTFLAGLASQEEVDNKTVGYIWDALISIDVDWLGLRHIELIIRTLEQAFDDARVPHRKKLLDNIYQWLRASLRKPENDNSNFDKTLQEHLSHALLLSPQVASVCFKKLHAEWPTLKPEEKNIALKIYIAPLSQCVANVAVFFVDILKKPEELQNYWPILQQIDWANLKDAAVASELTQYFLVLLKSSPAENLKILAIIALSKLADITDTKTIDEIIEILQKDLSHTENIISLYAALAMEKLTGKDQALLKRLTGLLQSEDVLQKQEAIKAASRIFKFKPATRDLIEILLAFLDDKEKEIHENAVQVLQEIAENESEKQEELQRRLSKILQKRYYTSNEKRLLNDDDNLEKPMEKRKNRWIYIAKEAGDPSQDFLTRVNAIRCLAECLKEEISLSVVQMLLTALRDEDQHIRPVAASALSDLWAKIPPEVVNSLLKSHNNNASTRVKKGLSTLGESLLKILEDRDKDNRVVILAARFLGCLGEDMPLKVKQSLVKLIEDNCIDVSIAATEALYQRFDIYYRSETNIMAIDNIRKASSSAQKISRFTVILLLDNLTSSDDNIKQAGFTQLQIFYREQPEAFNYYLLQALIKKVFYLPLVINLILIFNVHSTVWLKALKQFLKKQEKTPNIDLVKIIITPLIILMLREGIGIYPEAGGLLLYTAHGCHKFELPANLSHANLLPTILQITQEFLQPWGITCQSHAEWQQAQRPFYAQRSSVRFFQGESAAEFFPAFGVLPLLTHNQDIAARKSETVVIYLKEIFVGNTIVQKEGEGYEVKINPVKHAVKIDLDLFSEHCQKNKMDVLHEALKTHVFNSSACYYLDISENALTDIDLEMLLEHFLSKPESKNLRLLRLSFNEITSEGLKNLLKALVKNPSIKYLLLDHNFIDFDLYFCDEYLTGENALLEKTGLVHLDISMNYIATGKRFESNVVVSDETLKNHVTDAKEREFNQQAIDQSLIVHSQFYFPVYSLLDTQRVDIQHQIHGEQGMVGLFAYETKIPGVNDHAFMMLEYIDATLGQRRLIKAHLVQENGKPKILIHYFSPEKFQETLQKRPAICLLAMITRAQIEKLLEEILKSQANSDFKNNKPYSLWSNNCLTWAAEILQKIEVIENSKEWIPRIPSPIVAVRRDANYCVTM